MNPRVSLGSVLPVPASAGANGALRVVVGGRDGGAEKDRPAVELSSLPIGRRSADTTAGVRASATAPVASVSRSTAVRQTVLVDPALLTTVQGGTQEGASTPSAAGPATTATERAAGATEAAKFAQADSGAEGLKPDELRTVEALRRRDSTVRQQEQAQAAKAGQFAGAPIFEYVTGPDDKRYAVSGDVPVRTNSPSGDPEKLAQALAALSQTTMTSAAPSAQDRAVAQQALNQADQIATLDDDRRPAPANRVGRASNTGQLFDIAG